MQKNDNTFVILVIITMIGIIGGICMEILKEIEELRIDHKCYMISDEEFYKTEMCRPYWGYRRNK